MTVNYTVSNTFNADEQSETFMDTQTFKVRDIRNKQWFFADNVFFDEYAKHFGAIGTSVYMSLCRHSDGEQKCFPSQELIAEEFGITSRSVRTYLGRLEKANLIRVTKKKGRSGGRWLRNEYWLVDKSDWKSLQEISSSNLHRKQKEILQETGDIEIRNTFPSKDTHSNNTHKNNTNKAKQGFADTDAIIEKFKAVNPNYESFHRNTTQRKATERLIQKMGMEPLTAVIDELAGVVAKPFCPVITSPYTLEKKLADLLIFLQRKKRDNFEGGIAGITKPFKKSKYAGL